MKNEIKDIIPNEGLGVIKFGIKPEDLIAILGKPDDVEHLDSDTEGVEGPVITYHYEDDELSFIFDGDYDNALVSLACSDPFYQYNGRSLVGMDLHEIKYFFSNLGIEISNEAEIPSEESDDLLLLEIVEFGMHVLV